METTGKGWVVGGIIGMTSESSEVRGCCSAGSVKGETQGGIVGRGNSNDNCWVEECFFVRSSDTGSADGVYGSGGVTNQYSDIVNSIAELNQFVSSLNADISEWNGKGKQQQCNYTFTAGNPADSTMPTISAKK